MFAALICRTGADARRIVSKNRLAECFPKHMPSDVTGEWSDPTAVMAGALMWNTPASKFEEVPYVCPRTGRIILSWARIDNRAEVAAAIGITGHQSMADSQLILEAYDRVGEESVSLLDGDFSFLIYDPKANSCFVARDPIGAKPLFYVDHEDYLIVASSVAIIRNMSIVELSPSSEWMASYLATISYDLVDTAYEEVKRLSPGHTLLVEREKKLETKQYFSFNLVAPFASERNKKWVDEYKLAFFNAVDKRADSAYLIGAEYSGGLDSTSIIGRLIQVLPHDREQFHCFASILQEKEPEAIVEPIVSMNLQNTHILAQPRGLKLGLDYENALDVIGYPLEHDSVITFLPFLEFAQRLGIRTLFSGFGGDEIVTNFSKFAAYEMLAHKHYRAALEMQPGSLPQRLWLFSKLLRNRKRNRYAETRESLVRVASRFPFKDSLQANGVVGKIDRLVSAMSSSRSLSEADATHPFFRSFRVVRLESYALIARQYGIEFRWPLLDFKLIQTYLQTPAIEKQYNGWGRYLHRRAVDGLIPDSVCWLRGKDMGPIIDMQSFASVPAKLTSEDVGEALTQLVDFEQLHAVHDRLEVGLSSKPWPQELNFDLFMLIALHRLAIWTRRK